MKSEHVFDLDLSHHLLTFSERTAADEASVMRWVLSTWNSNAQDKGINRKVRHHYWKRHNEMIRYLAGRGWVLISTIRGKPQLTTGFLCGDAGALHFGYTKEAYRQDGVFLRMVAAAPTHEKFFTCPPQGQSFLWNFFKQRKYEYNPYRLLEIRGNHANQDSNVHGRDTSSQGPGHSF